METLARRKINALTIAQKLKLIEDAKDRTVSVLATMFKIGDQTVRDILRKKDEIKNYAAMSSGQNALIRKRINNSSLSDEIYHDLYAWFMLQRKCGNSLNRKLKGPEGFQASRGLVWRFKKSFGIRCLKISGEKLTADIEAANNFEENSFN